MFIDLLIIMVGNFNLYVTICSRKLVMGDRINIFPSRGAQTLMKGRLKGAKTGHSLLKKKADALQLKFRSILKKIIETKQLMGEVMKEASFSLAEAKFASSGDLNQVNNGFFSIIFSL